MYLTRFGASRSMSWQVGKRLWVRVAHPRYAILINSFELSAKSLASIVRRSTGVGAATRVLAGQILPGAGGALDGEPRWQPARKSAIVRSKTRMIVFH